MHCLVPHNVECTMYTMHLKTPKCPPIPLSNTVFCSVEHGEHIAWYQTLKLYTLLCSIHFLPCMEYDTFMFLLLWALWQCSFSSITGQAPLCWSPCATSLSRYLLKKGVANFIQRQKRVADIVQMCQYCVDMSISCDTSMLSASAMPMLWQPRLDLVLIKASLAYGATEHHYCGAMMYFAKHIGIATIGCHSGTQGGAKHCVWNISTLV